MKKVATFTPAELTTAFSLILSKPAAKRWAREWFKRFGNDAVDADGRFLYRNRNSNDHQRSSMVAAVGPPVDPSGPTGYEEYSLKSDDEIGECLMYFSDFHLTLASLVSPELGERIRIARGDTMERHERRRTQMRRIVESMRPKR